jgi:CheY-like chemotaxis protein
MPRILVVDDERGMRLTLADILRDRGCRVETAETGEQAVRLCAGNEFDMVLMDVRMPGIDGTEALRRIRKRRSDARVIMMTAYALEHLEREALALGAIAFLRKPLDVDALLELIDGALAGSGT